MRYIGEMILCFLSLLLLILLLLSDDIASISSAVLVVLFLLVLSVFIFLLFTNKKNQDRVEATLMAENRYNRSRFDEQLIATDNRYRALFDSAAEAVIITDKYGVISGVNRSAEMLFGYNAEDIVGKNVSVLVPESNQGAHDAYIRDFHRTGKSQIIGVGREVKGRRKNGSLFPVHIAIGQYREDNGFSFMAIVHDLSNENQH